MKKPVDLNKIPTNILEKNKFPNVKSRLAFNLGVADIFHSVAIQLKTFTSVGIAIIIVAAVK